jgi:RNA polymerase sigma factor (sigma-70 family)
MRSGPIPQTSHAAPRMNNTPLTAAADPLADLFARHYRDLVRLVSGLLDDNETCEEVVQDAFAAIMRQSQPPRPGAEGAYLRSAALNGARSQLRKRQVRRRHLQAVPSHTPDNTEAAENPAIARVEADRVLATIRTLPRRQSEVLLLRFQADLSETEIAETLGISPGSVKTHARRGLAAVRRQLEDRS